LLELFVSVGPGLLGTLWIDLRWGMENPCNKDDMELFYGLTSITIGNGNKAPFWDDSWVDGTSTKVLASSIYEISRQKTSSVHKATTDDAWVWHLDTLAGLSVQHLQEFTTLWGHTSQLILHDNIPDSITWKLTSNRVYSCSSTDKW
jgi:hypothetical protein